MFRVKAIAGEAIFVYYVHEVENGWKLLSRTEKEPEVFNTLKDAMDALYGANLRYPSWYFRIEELKTKQIWE